MHLFVHYQIREAFHNNFPRISAFGFRRKLAGMKTQQGIEKVNEHNGCTVFLRSLVFLTHQQKWRQLCFITYPLFVLLLHNFHQLPFSPPPPPLPLPLTPPEHAATILDRVSVTPGVAFPYLHSLDYAIAPVQQPRTGISR